MYYLTLWASSLGNTLLDSMDDTSRTVVPKFVACWNHLEMLKNTNMRFPFLECWSNCYEVGLNFGEIHRWFSVSSVQFSHSVVSDSLWPHESQHTRPPCPSPTCGVHSNSCPLSRWCHPAISSSVIPFSSCPRFLPASGSFPMSQLFAWDGQSIGVSASASIRPRNTQDWSPLGWTGWVFLQSKGLSRVFSNTTVQKHQFFGAQLSSQSNSHIHTWPLKWFIRSF